MALTYGTATFTNGQQAVTSVSLDSGTLTYFQAGTEIAVGANPQIATVEAQKATGASSFNLKEPWAYASGTYAFLASNTSEAFANGVQAAKGFQDALQSAADNQGTAAAADVTTGPTDTAGDRVLRAGDAYASNSQNWHKGNANFTDFTLSGGDTFIGVARSSSVVQVWLQVPFMPTSISVSGSFDIVALPGGSVIESGVTPTLSANSSNKFAVISFSGSFTRGDNHVITPSGSSSSIIING